MLRDQGATPASSPGELAVAADVLITSLPSIAAFEQVVAGEDGISSVARTDLVVVEASTLPIAVKTRGRDILARRGITLLDCH